MGEAQNPLRLRKKHGSGKPVDVTAANGAELVQQQSLGNAIVAGLVAVIVFSLFWVSVSELSNRVFPWFTVLLGFLLGYSIRLAGRGVDWRFPLLAALLALAGSLFAHFVVAASVTADGFGTGTLDILSSVTLMTWPVFFEEVLTAADGFYAVVAAGLAAFYANRRLTRRQYHALRLWKEATKDN